MPRDAVFRNTEEHMRALKVFVASCIMTAAAIPAFADNMAPTMGMMKGGEVVAVMPDGHMGTMMVDEGAAMKMAPAATIAEMMKATPEQMKTGMDDWMKWADGHKKEIVEMGAPLGKTKRVTNSGMSDTKNEITGYSIVQGDSFDSVAKIFKG